MIEPIEEGVISVRVPYESGEAQQTLRNKAQLFYKRSLEMFGEYAEKIWGADKPSFHNGEHVEAMWKAAESIFEAVERDDLFDLKSQLAAWQEESGYEVGWEEFKYLVKIAVALHDWGNMMDENGEYLPSYQVEGAEGRSKKIFTDSELASGLEPEQRSLVLHLIDMTKSAEEEDLEAPFSRFMKVIDRLSSFSFRDNIQVARGLLTEWLSDPKMKDKKLSLRDFMNFTMDQGKVLLQRGGEDLTESLYRIWPRRPEEDERWSSELKSIPAMLEEMNYEL